MIGLTNVSGTSGVIAFITVTYPAGSVCTCTKGAKTLTAKDTSGSYVFSIKETGSWTVSCTNGIKTSTQTVSVSEWQGLTVNLAYIAKLIENGTVLATFETSGGTVTSGETYATFATDGGYARIAYVKVNVSGFTTLTISLNSGVSYVSTDCPSIGVSSSAPTIDQSTALIASYLALQRVSESVSIASGTYTIDISNLTGELYIFMAVSAISGTPGALNIIDFYAE